MSFGRIDRVVNRVDELQREKAPLAVAYGIVKKYGEDNGSQYAMLMSYKGFFSIAPLLLAFVASLGLLLAGNESLRDDIVDSTLANLPAIGTDITAGVDALSASVLVLVASALVSLWAGLGLIEVIGQSLDTIWEVPRFERPSFVARKLRSASAAVMVALCAVLSGASRWVLAIDLPWAVRVFVGALFPVVAGALGYLALHRCLCSYQISLKSHLPGMVGTGLAWWGLQALGGLYFTRVVNQSSDTYGVFAVVLGLLSWSYLLGTMYLYCVELTSVLEKKRWPRSLSGRSLTVADSEAIERIAQRDIALKGTQVQVDSRAKAEEVVEAEDATA